MRLDSEETYDKFVTYRFIQGTDNSRTGKVKEDLANQFALGVNSYPCYFPNTTNMIINYKKYVSNPNHPCN